jgi:hypothetical protein
MFRMVQRQMGLLRKRYKYVQVLQFSKGKGKPVRLQAWNGPEEVTVPRFHDNGTGLWLRLSALRTGRLYPQEIPRSTLRLQVKLDVARKSKKID